MTGEWEQEGAAFQYEIRDGRAAVLQWKGSSDIARIPEKILDAPVERICRKAFLSNKRLREIYLPGGVQEIGDWAFAYCSALELVHLPGEGLTLGKGLFLQCERLERITASSGRMTEMTEPLRSCTEALLAAAAHKLEAPYLLQPDKAGSKRWLEKWDGRLRQVMEIPDREGYSKTILCGEEDYGSMENNLDFFLSQKRRSKVRLALLRLLHDVGLSPDLRIFLTEYLNAHTKGCAWEETWKVVLEEYGTRREYYDLLLETGALTEQNFDGALQDMGAELAEMKAYLLRRKEERFGENSFFDSLLL